jgi:hypothetical protein
MQRLQRSSRERGLLAKHRSLTTKNQYFGDKRDLLKFSLLEELASRLAPARQLTCIWLLTPPSDTHDGNRHFSDHSVSPNLGTFLGDCVKLSRRDVREFKIYAKSRGIDYFSYGDEATLYFTASNRKQYFEGVPDRALRRSIVFFDPDNGFEPARIVTAAHLKFTELRGVFERMDNDSVAVVYQHRRRQSHNVLWSGIAAQTRSILRSPVGFIASSEVGFFIAARNRTTSKAVNDVLRRFSVKWLDPLLVSNLVP